MFVFYGINVVFYSASKNVDVKLGSPNFETGPYGGFLKLEYPQNLPKSIHFSIETHGHSDMCLVAYWHIAIMCHLSHNLTRGTSRNADINIPQEIDDPPMWVHNPALTMAYRPWWVCLFFLNGDNRCKPCDLGAQKIESTPYAHKIEAYTGMDCTEKSE